jgi:hypothetical protein
MALSGNHYSPSLKFQLRLVFCLLLAAAAVALQRRTIKLLVVVALEVCGSIPASQSRRGQDTGFLLAAVGLAQLLDFKELTAAPQQSVAVLILMSLAVVVAAVTVQIYPAEMVRPAAALAQMVVVVAQLAQVFQAWVMLAVALLERRRVLAVVARVRLVFLAATAAQD